MSRILRFLLPVVVVAVAAFGAVLMVRSRSVPQPEPRVVPPPIVRIAESRITDRRLTVTTQGTVAPRVSIALVAEVSGRAVDVAPNLVAGGFFEEGDILLVIDPRDYELSVVRSRAEVQRAKLMVAREEAEADVAREEWAELGEGKASPLATRELQLAEARSTLASAEAALARAELDLERTRVRAPFAGRVRAKNVDLGQFVTRGAPLADVYAVDAAEVRLPVSANQMAYLDLPLDFHGEGGPEVTLRTSFAGREHTWAANVVRVEGEVDPRTRLVHVVARVRDPYSRDAFQDTPPLAPGLFVEAEIAGLEARDVVALPRSALRGRDRVFVVEDGERLRFRGVDVLRATGGEVIIASGLAEGEQVCISALEAAVDGMRVRVERPAGGGASPEDPA